MANAKIIQEKQQAVEVITAKLRESSSTVVADYRGLNVAQVTELRKQLREAGISDLAQTTLMSDGASVYLCTSNDEVIDLVSRGQGVFGIAVGKVLREVESSLVELDSIKGEDPSDELAVRRAHRAS